MCKLVPLVALIAAAELAGTLQVAAVSSAECREEYGLGCKAQVCGVELVGVQVAVVSSEDVQIAAYV